MAKIKLYTAIIHTATCTRKAYIQTSSKEQAKKLLGISDAYASNNLSIVTHPKKIMEYRDLAVDTVKYESFAIENDPVQTLRSRDFDRIGAISVVTMSELMLQQCDIPDSELKERLNNIRKELLALRADLKEDLHEHYSSFMKLN
ncbi:TPA: hypothetical protein ACX6RO_001794 [Photobacterium damselae]